MLNWIVWNRTVYLCKKWIWHWITYKGWYAIKPKQPTTNHCSAMVVFLKNTLNNLQSSFIFSYFRGKLWYLDCWWYLSKNVVLTIVEAKSKVLGGYKLTAIMADINVKNDKWKTTCHII